MYKAVIFDLYGTLLDIHTDETQPILWEKLAYYYSLKGAFYNAQELQTDYLSEVEWQLSKLRKKGYAYPDIDILKVFSALYKAKGVKVRKEGLRETARFFRVLSLDYVKPYPGAVELLTYLKASGVKVLLLSNAQESFTMDELRVTGIIDYFDRIYLSSDYQMAKPAAAYFEILLEKEKLKAKTCLFIGNDHTTDIAGATAVAMDSLYMHTNCSQAVVPELITAKWRVDSGDLVEVLEIIRSLS
jgi:putative hydrolase of the HAD superfamily